MDERFCRDLMRQVSVMSLADGGRADLPFLSMVQHVRAFAEVAGRFPDGGSSDQHEALLGRWLQQQREMAAMGALGHTLRVFAEAALGRGWAAQGADNSSLTPRR